MIFKGQSKRHPVVQSRLNPWPRMIVLMSFLLGSFVDVEVRGWLKLTSDQRERCIMKLRYRSSRSTSAQLGLANSTRDLVRQRNMISQSIPVDASELKDRLK